MNLKDKYENLKKIILKYENCAVAFSGGVDSSFLTKVCYDIFQENSIAVTVVSPMLPKSELSDAVSISSFVGIKHYFIEEHNIEEEVSLNPIDRCYHCKKTEFGKIKEFAKTKGIDVVFDGTNIDDIGDYRPGMKAADELGIISPLKEAEFSKEDIREMSKILGLKTWEKPSFACLASRVPYGEKITTEKLNRIEKSEDFLKKLGFIQFRVRAHENIARLEISPKERTKIFNTDIMDEISKELKTYGFKFVCLELEGYFLGSMNKLI